MSSIFLSHAAVDTELAELLVNFLKEAIGVPHAEIFCSSVIGHGVPMTKDFNKFMKSKIQEPKLVLLLMTPSYMESAFCLMELGAAWAKSHVALPIVVPPLSYDDVTRTLGQVQAWNISKHSGLIDLRKIIVNAGIDLEDRHEHVWEKKKINWQTVSKKVITKLPKAANVSARVHMETVAALEESLSEIKDLETVLDDKDELIEKLKMAKDAVDVKTIVKKLSGKIDPKIPFNEVMNEVKSALPSMPRVILLHIIMDHYGKTPTIDWMSDKQEFEAAIQKNIIENDEGYPVAWNRPKLKNLRKALTQLDSFLDGQEGTEFLASLDDDMPSEADDLEFWLQYL